jgi:hypothetical protein
MDLAASDKDPHDPKRGSRPHTNDTTEPTNRFNFSNRAPRQKDGKTDYDTVLED